MCDAPGQPAALTAPTFALLLPGPLGEPYIKRDGLLEFNVYALWARKVYALWARHRPAVLRHFEMRASGAMQRRVVLKLQYIITIAA